jgi:pimeloyl-ACP methyl ester carboxylesterase
VLRGGTACLQTMRYQIIDLALDHLVVASDSRGHGRSSDPAGPLHYADMADDMIALMDRLHIANADVVGWRDGALDLAKHHPVRVGRIVTIGANFYVAGLVDPTSPPGPESVAAAGRRDFYRSVPPILAP